MPFSHLSEAGRLYIAIAISCCFFLAELVIGLKTHSVALIADAFHTLNDLVSLFVALVTLRLSSSTTLPRSLTFGWQRARILGAFFNGVFLLALGFGIFLQAVERFVTLQRVKDVPLVLVTGSVGVLANIVVACILGGRQHAHHTHGEDGDGKILSPFPSLESGSDIESGGKASSSVLRSLSDRLWQGDLAIRAVILHLLGDIVGNIGVVSAALIMMFVASDHRFYADPGISMLIALAIVSTAAILVHRTGHILLGSSPEDMDVEALKKTLEQVPGVQSVHALQIWRLDQSKVVVSAHVLSATDSFWQAVGQPDASASRQHRESSQPGSHNEHLKTVSNVLRARLRDPRIHSMTIQIEYAEEKTQSQLSVT